MQTKKPKPLQNLNIKIRWLMVLALTAFIFFMVILYQQKLSQEKIRNEVYDTYVTINKLELINKLMAETEASSRGYLLTNDSTWITSLLHQHNQLLQTLTEIEKLFEKADRHPGQLLVLKRHIQKKIDIQQIIINSKVITKELLEKIRRDSEAGRITRAVKSLVADLSQAESQKLSDKINKNESTYNSGVFFAVLGALFAFTLVSITLFQLNNDIRRRKKAEEEVSQSEARYRNLIENAGVVMSTTDAQGRITFVNGKVKDLTGYSAEELLGKHFSLFTDPGSINWVTEIYANQFAKKIPTTNIEFTIRTKNGIEKWVEQSAQLLIENEKIAGLQCMAKDITEQKKVSLELSRSELQRKENEYRLNAILENTTAQIFIKDLNSRYVLVNKRFREMVGLPEEMIINKTDADLVPEKEAQRYLRSDREIISRQKNVVESEVQFDLPSGKKSMLSIKFPLYNDAQAIFGIGGIVTDITERVLDRERLVAALSKTEEAMQLQEQFFANMSHEIRTPLNGIQGMNNLLQQTSLTEEQRDYTNMISQSLNKLLVLLNDVLDFSNLRAGKLTLSHVSFDLMEILEDVQNMFVSQVNYKQLDFRVIVDPAVPLFLTGDPYRLKQVLINLVGNAIKFTKKGRVHLSLSLAEKEGDATKIQFKVEDTGIGIREDKQETIFKSFAQADPDISRSYGGTGLGLAISKGLVELQGGSIAVKSKPGEGSIFTITIPYQLKNSPQQTFSLTDFASKLSGKEVLLVEDNEVNQKLIVAVLKKVGVNLAVASHGKEALAFFEKGRNFDLVILDLQMPVMDGYETATYLRQDLGLDIPIIAMTATALKGDQEKCREVGMNDFMLKPFEFNDLYKRLVSLLYQESHETGTFSGKPAKEEKLFDLSLLEELDDKESLLDVLELFLGSSPNEVKSFSGLAAQKDWNAIFKVAHKVKGAVSILQADTLSRLLGELELNAKEESDTVLIVQQVEKVLEMFSELERQLRERVATLKKEIG